MATEDDLIAAALAVLAPLDQWAVQCHRASAILVQSGRFGVCRVARGACEGVSSQHSWVVLGRDVYASDATIIDPTLWSQSDDWREKLGVTVWIGSMRDRLHRPHGSGFIWDAGRPARATEIGEAPMELTPRQPWSREAKSFLDEVLGPLGEQGWIQLAHLPMQGWPSAEIIDAMCESGLTVHIPMDIVGMVTDRDRTYLSPEMVS